MFKIRKFFVFFIIFSLVLSSTACNKANKKPSPEEESEKKMPKVVKVLEKDILTIIYIADLIPYYKRSLAQRDKLAKEDLEEQAKLNKFVIPQMKDQGTSDSNNNNNNNNSNNNNNQQNPTKSPNDVQKTPDPLMFQEMLLSNVIKEEKILDNDKDSKKLPQDLNDVWKKLNDMVIKVHETWNILEPMLLSKNAASISVYEFKKNLELLTKYSLNHDYYNTILLSNNLTSSLPEFMAYGKTKIPPTIYSLKYFLRDCVLKASRNDFSGAKENLEILYAQSLNVKDKLKGKDAQIIIEKFEASIKNLNDAIDRKEVNLIKINAGIVMKNIIAMSNDIESQIS